VDWHIQLIVMGFMASAWALRVGRRELRAARARAAARERLRAGATQIADRTVVTVTGTVRASAPDALLEAPLSGRRVVYHRSVVRMRLHDLTLVAAEMVPFELETAEGIVRIEGDAADVILPPLPVIPRDLERVRRFLAANNESTEHAAAAGIDEIAIEPGARIAVQGLARVEVDPAGAGERGYREDAPTRVTLEPHPAHPLTIGPP
jgi:hypothetical protein